MATFSATAASTSTLGYTFYGSADWKTGTENGACQGAYSGSSINDSRVGFMLFSGVGEALNGSNVSEIALTIKCGSAGHNATDRVLTLCKSNYQTMPTTQKGSAVFGDVLGTLKGNFYNNTVTFTLNASTNTALFAAMKSYFQSGNSALIAYNGEYKSRSGGSSSYNYLRITSASISVAYTERPVSRPCACEWVNGTYRKYEMYTYAAGKWTLRIVRDGASIKPEPDEPEVLTYVTYPTAAMTSNSSQSCVASASSTYSSSFPIYYAFDNTRTNAWAAQTSDSAPWIQLKVPQALKNISVKVYSWSTSNVYKGEPVSGTLMGSTNGSTWTQIGSYSGWAENSAGFVGEIVCTNDTAYNYVRLNIASYTSGKGYVSIGYMTVTGGVPT